ncbi:MAG: hypothetical protein ACR2K5_15900 [Pseudolabrys sp.]
MNPGWINPTTIVAVIGMAVLLIVFVVWQHRRRHVPPRQRYYPPVSQPDPAASLFANGNRPTEDDIAQARLGGSRGAAQLGAAPMVRQVAKNTPPPADPGHVV